MLEDVPGRTLLLGAGALFPAALIWWRGRALARSVNDPTLPERLLAAQRRGGSILGIACGLLIVASPDAIDWTLPLLIAGYVTAAYPLRKKLYDETWTLAGYLSFMGRIALAVWGFWIALGMLPFYTPLAGRYDWLAAGLAAIVLLLWNARYVDICRWLLRSRALRDAVLLERFAGIAQRSGIAAPRFEWVPLAGGAISNAVALPGSRQSAVLFTDTFLAQMDADEATAVCAHEIAHLEHHTPRYLRRLSAVNIALIVGAVVAGLLPRRVGLQSALLPSVIWMIVLVGNVMWRARDRQKHETASDLRAVALCGDGEALVRALTKLYTFARMPRRLDAETERHATHPSLARRIRDIRAAAGSAPATLGATSTFAAADGCAVVTFDTDRLHWREGEVASHSLSYSQFSELRLQVAAGGAPSLIAVERGGRKWQIALSADEVTRLQAVLDIVDGRLADPQPAPAAFARLGRLTAGFAAAMAVVLGQFAMAFVAVIALLQPSAALLASAGAAALCSAVITYRRYATAGLDTSAGLSMFLAALAAALLLAAYSRRQDEAPRGSTIALSILGICTAVWCGVVVLNGLHPVDLHRSSRHLPAAAVFLAATGAALASRRARAARYAAAPLALAGLAVLTAGSSWFLERFGRDPFLGSAQPLTWTTVTGSLQAEIHAPFYASAVAVSPSGRAVIVERTNDDGMSELQVGRPGGRLTRVHADQLVFLDDNRLLAVDEVAGGAEVRAMSVDAPDSALWRHRVTSISGVTLSYLASTATWRMVGTADGGGVVRLEGTVGSESVRETRWRPIGRGRLPDLTAVSGDTALVVETGYRSSLLEQRGLWQFAMLLPGDRMQSRFSRMTADANSEIALTRLHADCDSTSVTGDQLICTAFDGTQTRLASIDAATGNVALLASMPGHFAWYGTSSSGWLSGWVNSQAVAVHPGRRQGIRLAGAPQRMSHLVMADGVLAAVSHADGASTIRLYAVDTNDVHSSATGAVTRN